jgi:hypothetical protein
MAPAATAVIGNNWRQAPLKQRGVSSSSVHCMTDPVRQYPYVSRRKFNDRFRADFVGLVTGSSRPN